MPAQKKHFYPAKIPTESGILRIVGDTPYRIALALKAQDHFIALCFSRFQYEDGVQIANTLLPFLENTAVDFFGGYAPSIENFHASSQERIHTDIFSILSDREIISRQMEYSFFAAISLLFEKLNSSFGAFGYRIHTKIAPEHLAKKNIALHFQDFLFLFGKLLYMQMRISENRNIFILLTSNEKEHIFRISAKTENFLDPLSFESPTEIISRAVPECALEALLLEKMGLFRQARLHFFYDDPGVFTVEYSIPYLENQMHSLKSINLSLQPLTEDIDRFIENLEKRLTDIGASY